VIADTPAQDRVEDVGDGVVALDVRAALLVDDRADGRSLDDLRRIAGRELGQGREGLPLPPHVDHPEREPIPLDRARVRHLPAACPVERVVPKDENEAVVGPLDGGDDGLDFELS
jgi:hypothetical protein